MPAALLVLSLFSLADAGGPATPRSALALCVAGSDATVAFVQARPRAAQGEWAWELSWSLIDARGLVHSARTTARAPADMDAVPATPELSWTELDDGSLRLWTPRLSALVAPPRGRGRAVMASLQGHAGELGCDGALLMTGGAQAVLLVLPQASTAVGAQADGWLTTMSWTPLPGEPPPRPGRRRREAAAAATARAFADDRVRLEPVDVRRDAATRRTITAAWRVLLLPSRSAGLLLSRRASVVADGFVLHQVTGSAELAAGRTDMVGAVLEPLP